MDKHIQHYLIQLSRLSKIPENAKLDTLNNEINIYVDNWWNRLRRAVSGDGRTRNFTVVKNVVNILIDSSNFLMQSDSDESREVLIRILNQFDAARIGLGVLINSTYANDPNAAGSLEYISNDLLANQIKKIKQSINLTS